MSGIIEGNGGQSTIVQLNGVDGYAAKVARILAVFTNTFSPACRGAGPLPMGLDGYGVNRATGYTPPLQNFRGAARPVLRPSSTRLGAGAGVSGQPGLPGTNDMTNPGLTSLALITQGQTAGLAGLGS